MDQVDIRQITREYLEDPEIWPHKVLLPLKRRKPGGGFPDCGFVTRAEPLVLVHAGIFDTLETIDSAMTTTFGSVDEMISAGWELD